MSWFLLALSPVTSAIPESLSLRAALACAPDGAAAAADDDDARAGTGFGSGGGGGGSDCG